MERATNEDCDWEYSRDILKVQCPDHKQYIPSVSNTKNSKAQVVRDLVVYRKSHDCGLPTKMALE